VAERAALPSWLEPARYGVAASGVVLAQTTITAAWNVQGDASDALFATEAGRLFGVALPTHPNTIARSEALGALWLGPRSWLLVAGGESPLADFMAKREALNAARGALFDLGASRVAWTVGGAHAATVLAKGSPLDFHPRSFPPGSCAQSLLGHVAALFARAGDASAFTVMVARSYARDAWRSLLEAAAQYGVEVRPPTPYR